ncbi:prominin-like protein isoform X3 [Cryptotermes secundus]|uniref:prominin-like protein isoform X3 n=1 Tax=Cryptotermes secundus TaxID=105785 RepID=UPI000CD7B706|nr:prominin-like protein isoform X3 [Cryptotermes secundus]
MGGRSASVCVMVLLVVQCVRAEDYSGLRGVVRHVEDAIRKEMMIEPVRYSDPNLTLSYQASPQFNARGMANLYKVTNFFMDIIQREDPYPEGFVVVRDDGSLQMAGLEAEWQTLLAHYAGVVAVVAVGLLFVVLMPCIGFIFCCCRCSGRCGARSQPFEKRRDPCKRISFGIMLAAITIIILFGVVCAFVTNEYMEDGTQKLPSRLRASVSDTKLYLSNTQEEVDTLLITNFGELKTVMDNVLQKCGAIVQQELAEVSRAVILSNLTELVDGLEIIKKDLQEIHITTKSLQNSSNNLAHNLMKVKRALEAELQKCNSSCKESLEKYVANMSTNADFQHLPQIEDSLLSVTEVIVNGKIKDKVNNGLREFDKIQQDIQNAIKDLIPKVSQNMRLAGMAIRERSKQINKILRDMNAVVMNHSSKAVDTGEKLIMEYGHYRYYAGLSVSSVMLVVLLCATLGLFYGFCGRRPDGYGDDCCSRATGARFLILGVWVIFLFSAVLMVVTLVHFLLGVIAERAVCEPLQSPNNNQLLALVDKMVRLDKFFNSEVEINVSSIIRSCHANGSIYEVLQVANLVNISEVSDYKSTYGIENVINQLKTRIDFGGNVTILTDDAKRELESLAQSNITRINFSLFAEVLNKSIVNTDLETLANQLRKTASEIPNTSDIRESLNKQANILESLQDDLVLQMERQVRALGKKTKALEENLKFNHSPLNESISLILMEVTKAQDYLNTTASREIKNLADMFANAVLDHVDLYLSRVVNMTTAKVGQCHPMSQVYNATVVAVCNQILDPFNGFWASIGWCLVLFIPAIILSVKLAALYQKSDPYPGPLVESEYLYDAYGDRDNIPLANVEKNYHRRYHETYENSSGYYGGDYSTHLGRGSDRGGGRDRASPSAHSDTRYTDMAPKYVLLRHWDYPNGGPPRYHSPPLSTEYERPPPYYYPGPGYRRIYRGWPPTRTWLVASMNKK